LNKKMKTPLKNLRINATYTCILARDYPSTLYAWPDPISSDSYFKFAAGDIARAKKQSNLVL
jgi:hypothetical protein